MSPFATTVVSIGVPLIVAALTFLGVQRRLAAERPKISTDTQAAASATARAEIQQALDALRADRDDARARTARAEEQSEKYRTVIDSLHEVVADLRDRLDKLESALQDAQEEAENLSEQLDEAREQNRLLRAELEGTKAQLEATREQLEATRAQLMVALRREQILTEHAHLWDDWWQANAPSLPGTLAEPPRLVPFDTDDTDA